VQCGPEHFGERFCVLIVSDPFDRLVQLGEGRPQLRWCVPVSYTHLDVYKRQHVRNAERILALADLIAEMESAS